MTERWITQTKFYDPADPNKGNCAEASCASLFGIPLEDVPTFYDPEGLPSPSYRYWRNFENFCMSRGYYVVRRDAEYIMEATYLASGPSARGCLHMVVMRNGELLHDPHPSRAGLLKVDQTWLLCPVDPFQFTRKP